MTQPVPMTEIWRGPMAESVHLGHAVICDAGGEIVEAWGDPATTILPRSSSKMIQALPLVTSGAARVHGLTSEQLALACASHNGAAIHTERVNRWLADLGLSDDNLRCGPQDPDDKVAHKALLCSDTSPCQVHNNCSGKHAGFLTLTRHLGAGPDYHEIDHPAQVAIKQAFEEVTGEDSPGYGIDGCSAPNHATSLHALARGMALFANAHKGSDTRSKAATSLVDAMAAHPELVNANGKPCTELMRLVGNRAAIKGGADGVYAAILPEQGLGVAIKISDGSERAKDAAIAMVLDKLGVLPDSPAARVWTRPEIRNRRDIHCGDIRPAAALA